MIVLPVSLKGKMYIERCLPLFYINRGYKPCLCPQTMIHMLWHEEELVNDDIICHLVNSKAQQYLEELCSHIKVESLIWM